MYLNLWRHRCPAAAVQSRRQLFLVIIFFTQLVVDDHLTIGSSSSSSSWLEKKSILQAKQYRVRVYALSPLWRLWWRLQFVFCHPLRRSTVIVDEITGIYRFYNIISHAAASVGVVTLCCVQLIPNRCIPPLRSVLPLPLQGRIMTLPRNLERRSCSSCPRQPLIFRTPPLLELVLSPYSHHSFNWFNIKDNDYVTLGFENDDMILKKIDKALRVLCSSSSCSSDEQPTVFHSKVKSQVSYILVLHYK